jgi:hypothetical protein
MDYSKNSKKSEWTTQKISKKSEGVSSYTKPDKSPSTPPIITESYYTLPEVFQVIHRLSTSYPQALSVLL